MKTINYAIYAAGILFITSTSCKKAEMNENISSVTEDNFLESARMAKKFKNSKTDFYLLSNGLQLDKYTAKHLNNNTTPVNSAAITGLQGSETILAIDFRPATGQLYGLGSTSRIYVINPVSGTARMIGSASFTPALAGTIAAFDFNPTVDRIRIVTSTGQNLRVNPETGAVVATDGNINGQPGAMISSAAYTNNSAGETTTTLYDIDPVSDMLFIQNPPNAGTIAPVGSLNINIDGEGGFDISPDNEAVAVYKVNNVSTLFEVNLSTGEANVITTFSNPYTAIAIPTSSVAYAVNSSNELLILGLDKHGTHSHSVITKPVTGLGVGETILGLDMRPLNGQLYALGSSNNIYTINSASGLATLAFALTTPLTGTDFGFDFNPLVDRIRIVSNTGQNLRFNPNDGTTLTDGNLNPGTPSVSAAAYTNNFAGTVSTSLLAIDHNADKLYSINPPNAGTLVMTGDIDENVSSSNGFDIGGTSGDAYAVFRSGNNTNLYLINTATGKASKKGSLGNHTINGFTIGLGF